MLSKPNTSAREKIRTQMERMRPSFVLVYCADDPKVSPASFKYEQRIFRLPPMEHVTISDVVGVPANKAYDYSLGPSQPRPWRTRDTGRGPKERVTIASAEKVVSHAVAMLWKRGVALLTGSIEDDAREVQEATSRWRQWQQKQDETVVGAFHKRLEDFTSDPRNKHLSPPMMGKLEREAQTRLDRFRFQEANIEIGRDLRCPVEGCSYWSTDPEELKLHAVASHGTSTTLTASTAAIEEAVAANEAKRQEKRKVALAEKKAALEAEIQANEAKAAASLAAEEAGEES